MGEVELKEDIIRPCGIWLKYFGLAMLMQLIAFIVVGIMMVWEIVGLSQQYTTGAISETQFLEQALSIMKKYIIVFVVLIVIVAIVAIITGLKLMPLKDYNILFLISGILIIVVYAIEIASGAYTIYWVKNLTLAELQNISETMSGSPIYSFGVYPTIIAFLLLGIALYMFGNTYSEYEKAKTPGILIIIGAILVMFTIGYLLIMIGLIMAGGALQK